MRGLVLLVVLLMPGIAGAQQACPENFLDRSKTEPLTCHCTAQAADTGSVFGTDIYMAYSAICRAARHAGVIPEAGGMVTVVPEPGRSLYPGTTRNGVPSVNYDQADESFSFANARPGEAPRTARSGIGMDSCPDDFIAFRGRQAPFTCGCSAEAATIGSVFGVGTYTDSSGVCKAALHAGVIGPQGGQVTLFPEPGRARYGSIMRNGISSVEYGPWEGSFRFTAPREPLQTAGGAPAQLAVAETLRERGRVSLYITFRFDSAELMPQARPLLQELLLALQADPSLRLTLRGHTDAVGTAAYNRTLSQRRAQSVVAWLASQGIAANRLAAEGRGPDEPVADNATEFGRAANRRVEAIRPG